MGALWADLLSPAFWVGAGQIIGINIILSGDNAVVIALACRMLPPRQRFWGMILGAGVAVLLRILFTLVVAEAMGYPWLKLVGGVLLLWVAVKLVVPEEERGRGQDRGRRKSVAGGAHRGHRRHRHEPRQCDSDRSGRGNCRLTRRSGACRRHQGDLDHLRSCHQHPAHHCRQCAADGVARSLSDPGMGGSGLARLGRGRHHDQGQRAVFLFQPGTGRPAALVGGRGRRCVRRRDRLPDTPHAA